MTIPNFNSVFNINNLLITNVENYYELYGRILLMSASNKQQQNMVTACSQNH